jgi:hypothetical protein
VTFCSAEIMQKLQVETNNLGAGTSESYPNHVVVSVVGDDGDGDVMKISFFLLSVNVLFFDNFCKPAG